MISKQQTKQIKSNQKQQTFLHMFGAELIDKGRAGDSDLLGARVILEEQRMCHLGNEWDRDNYAKRKALPNTIEWRHKKVESDWDCKIWSDMTKQSNAKG